MTSDVSEGLVEQVPTEEDRQGPQDMQWDLLAQPPTRTAGHLEKINSASSSIKDNGIQECYPRTSTAHINSSHHITTHSSHHMINKI